MAKGKSKKPKREYRSAWVCSLCEEHPLFETGALYLAHLIELHPELLVDETKLRARRSLLSALDGRDWYCNTYQYLDEDGKEIAQREESGPRAQDDWMRYV